MPEWRYIVLDNEQRHKLSAVKVKELVKSWTERTPAGHRVWALRAAFKHVKTYIEQEEMETNVRDIPQGLVCMHTPQEAVTLLPAVKVALHSLFENIQENDQKIGEYLQHKRPTYIFDRSDMGYIVWNYNSTTDYENNGRLSAPREMLSFLRSVPEFEVIDQFWSVYMKIIAKHFSGVVNPTSKDIAHIENLMSEHGDMCIIKYNEGSGMHLHIDNLLRSDATVFTVGVGRDVVYDVSHVLGREACEDVSIMRSRNPEGTMMLLDGEARYKWLHGIPFSHGQNGVKYTILISLFHTAGLTRPIGKCIEFNTDMYSVTACTQPAPEINAQMGALFGLLMQLENTHDSDRIDSHMPDRIKRPGLPRVHPWPRWT